jgi:hypothetical protein
MEQKLRNIGVVDVKFHIDPSTEATSEEILLHKLEVLEAVMAGNTSKFNGLGDSVTLNTN